MPGRWLRRMAVLLGFILLLAAALGGYLSWRELQKLHDDVAALSNRVEAVGTLAQIASSRAATAENAALEAARLREQAETDASTARDEAASARETAKAAENKAKAAEEEANRIRREADTELNRLQEALGQVAETRRTALGLVMNLGGDYLKFDFDKATIRQENRELLSRIAGILLTSKDYQISVHGHTDDVGSDAYNKDLSERRAKAVRDYLVQAGIKADVMSTEGFGKSNPLVPGTTEAARAKNRRVELGIVSTRIEYIRGTPRP